jgi:tRNA A37 N6-isopentenylltransferase MiaA
MEKLKEPAMVKETINDKTKKMLDDGKLHEARELIDLGEQIPEKLSEEIKLAEQLLNDSFYKKAKKSFLKAAELAQIIQEIDIVSFLTSKAEQVGKFPDLVKEQETILKEMKNKVEELHNNKLHLYHELIKPLDTLIHISNSFEEREKTKTLTEFLKSCKRADELAKDLFKLDKIIKEFLQEL